MATKLGGWVAFGIANGATTPEGSHLLFTKFISKWLGFWGLWLVLGGIPHPTINPKTQLVSLSIKSKLLPLLFASQVSNSFLQFWAPDCFSRAPENAQPKLKQPATLQLPHLRCELAGSPDSQQDWSPLWLLQPSKAVTAISKCAGRSAPDINPPF